MKEELVWRHWSGTEGERERERGRRGEMGEEEGTRSEVGTHRDANALGSRSSSRRERVMWWLLVLLVRMG